MQKFDTINLVLILLLLFFFTSCGSTLSLLEKSNGNVLLGGKGNHVTLHQYSINLPESNSNVNLKDAFSGYTENTVATLNEIKTNFHLSEEQDEKLNLFYHKIDSLIDFAKSKKITEGRFIKEIYPKIIALNTELDLLYKSLPKAKYTELDETHQIFWDKLLTIEFGRDNKLSNTQKIERLSQLSEITAFGSNGDNLWSVEAPNKYVELPFSSLSFLKHTPSLKELIFENNFISNIEDLEYTPYLKTLSLDNNNVKSLAKISSLSYLVDLSIKNNQLLNLNGIENLENLKRIDCTGNNIFNIDAIFKHIKLYPGVLTQVIIDTEHLSDNDTEKLDSLFNQKKSLKNYEKLYLL